MIKSIFKNVYRVAIAGGIITALLLLHILSFYEHQATGNADCVVVFGAAVWPGYYGPIASHALADRTASAYELYADGLTDCVVLSGGDSVYGAHEVDVMTDILLSKGVPEDAIELDREGVNTLATIENLRKDRSYILVSNDFHLARIGLLAKRSGLDQQGFALHAATYGAGSGSSGLSARYAREPYFVFREAVALVYYFFYTLI
jgi:vancomycin permeability regulator SanA